MLSQSVFINAPKLLHVSQKIASYVSNSLHIFPLLHRGNANSMNARPRPEGRVPKGLIVRPLPGLQWKNRRRHRADPNSSYSSLVTHISSKSGLEARRDPPRHTPRMGLERTKWSLRVKNQFKEKQEAATHIHTPLGLLSSDGSHHV